jgi:hypothetical protein
MYYFVWDMFCGWSAYDSRMHIVAEGESQTFYRLTPAPWGEFQPFGSLGREHYDSFNGHGVNIGMNVLKHTQHEPMVRLFVIEESWAKKYNLPDAVWKTRYDGSKSSPVGDAPRLAGDRALRFVALVPGRADVRRQSPAAVRFPDESPAVCAGASAGQGGSPEPGSRHSAGTQQRRFGERQLSDRVNRCTA